MNLNTYLNDKRKKDFAEKIGTSPSYLSQLLSGHRRPSFSLMVRIKDATNGAVCLNSWSPSPDAPLSEADSPDGSLPVNKRGHEKTPIQGQKVNFQQGAER